MLKLNLFNFCVLVYWLIKNCYFYLIKTNNLVLNSSSFDDSDNIVKLLLTSQEVTRRVRFGKFNFQKTHLKLIDLICVFTIFFYLKQIKINPFCWYDWNKYIGSCVFNVWRWDLDILRRVVRTSVEDPTVSNLGV